MSLHLRLNLIAAGPHVLRECVKYIEGEVRPALESQPDSLGLSLLISPGSASPIRGRGNDRGLRGQRGPVAGGDPRFLRGAVVRRPGLGSLISQTVWRVTQARAASPSTATVIQADVLNATDCVVRAVEDYSLVFSSAPKP